MGNQRDNHTVSVATPGATGAMVAEFLATRGFSLCAAPKRSHVVRKVVLDKGNVFVETDDTAETLLVCSVAQAAHVSESFSGIVCIVSTDDDCLEGEDARYSESLRPLLPHASLATVGASFFVNGTDSDCASVALLVADYLLTIGELCASFALAVSSRGLCQSLVNIAEDFFGYFIAITDSSNVLLGYSRHVLPEDEVNRSLVRLKYHAQSILRKQTDQAISKTITHQEGIQVFPPDGITFNHALVTYPIRINNQFAAYIVMTCTEENVTQGLQDAFGIFAHYCTLLCARRMGLEWRTSMASQNLLFHLIIEQGLSSVFIREQAELLGVPVKGCFAVAQVWWDTVTDALLADYAEVLCKSDIPCIALPHEGRVVVLMHCTGLDALVLAVRKLLGTYPVKEAQNVYISDSYSGLAATYWAYRSTLAIGMYADKLLPCTTPAVGDENVPEVISFRDIFDLYWSDPFADKSIRDFSARHMVAQQIVKDDIANGTDNKTFIQQYLANERRISEVAKVCHLHRNGVQYRLKKLQSMYYLDFDNYRTRHYVIAALNVHALLEGSRTIPEAQFPEQDGHGVERRPALPLS